LLALIFSNHSILFVFILICLFLIYFAEPDLDQSEGDVAKTKCREQIEEALKKYWNQG